MKEIECKEVIISKIATRGGGVVGDPYRKIIQVFEKDGRLIAEQDPHSPEFTVDNMLDFAKWCVENKHIKDEILISDINKWSNKV